MGGLEGADLGAGAAHHRSGLELVDLDGEVERVRAGEQHDLEQPLRRPRAVQVERRGAPEHREGAQEADGAEVVVGVEVAEEDGRHLRRRTLSKSAHPGRLGVPP